MERCWFSLIYVIFFAGCNLGNSYIWKKANSSQSVIPSMNFACGGSGTISDPYLICTPEQLAMLSSPTNSQEWNKYFKLQNNLDLSTATSALNPIGNTSTVFSGSFDGNNKTLSSLTTNNNTLIELGPFGVIQNATIKNITLTNFTITNSTVPSNSTGLLVGKALDSNIIENIILTGYKFK